jgi:alpha-N-arabinofuranosidase
VTGHLQLNIDWQRSAGQSSPMLFSYFVEHFHRQVYGGIYQPGSRLADGSGLRRDVLQAVRRLRPGAVRWPGGCFASSYHWRDGVGPERRASYDKAWRAEDPNTFGTDEFIGFCRAVGAEPYICTNAGTGTQEEMSDWVEYCNLPGGARNARVRAENGHVEPFGVRLWSIGNENYGHWEIGAREATEWGRFVLEAAKMMRRVDHRVTLSAAGRGDIDWDLGLLRTAGEQLDLLAVHAYAAHGDATYEQMIARSSHAERLIARAEHMLQLTGLSDRVRIAFDEWNPRYWHHPGHAGRELPDLSEWAKNDDNSTYTMADAVLHACFLNAALRHCQSVAMTNFSPLVNTRGPIFAHDEGVVLRPTFHVGEMYASSMLPEVLDPHVIVERFDARGEDGRLVTVPKGDAAVTINRETGQLALAVTNLHPDDPLGCGIWLPGRRLSRAAQLTTLTGSHVDDFNDVADPSAVVPNRVELSTDGERLAVDLPPHSVNVIELESS